MPLPTSIRTRFGFHAKAIAAIALIVLADIFFYGEWPGTTVGAFALAWSTLLAATVPAIRRNRRALIAAVCAGLFGLVLADDPSLLGWCLFWVALAMTALLPRASRFGDAWNWAVRLLIHAVTGVAAPIIDLRRLVRLRPSARRIRVGTLLPVVAIPLLGGAIFVALFASANPLIGNALSAIEIPTPSFARIAFWLVALLTIWSAFRPGRLVVRERSVGNTGSVALPGVSIASIRLSLLLFNAIFAVENGLDLAFLWSGTPLPDGVTLADYAHRGAYPLIATALLAGFFVLVTLRPGSDTASNALIRRLVVLWVAQNILLVASSILRTFDYIEAYSLTRLRIAALAWMLLVAIGLALICWRILRSRSDAWLINANATAAALMLTLASIVDLGSVAAAWNVRHAREVGGHGAALDLCYLNGLGASALVSLVELEQRPLNPAFRDRLAWVRQITLDDATSRQAEWRGWTWRNARRLAAARDMLPARPALRHGRPWERDCDGGVSLPPPTLQTVPPPPSRPLVQGNPHGLEGTAAPLTRKAER